jgi:hypothetical protein
VSEIPWFAWLDEFAAPGASGLPSLDERSDPPPKLVKMTMGVEARRKIAHLQGI